MLVEGQAVSGLGRKARAALRRRSIGFVFQDFNLLAGLTALENVAMPLELDGTPATPPEGGLARSRTLDELGLAKDRSRPLPRTTCRASGERQRVAIARAVVGERRLVLADEPTGAL